MTDEQFHKARSLNMAIADNESVLAATEPITDLPGTANQSVRFSISYADDVLRKQMAEKINKLIEELELLVVARNLELYMELDKI